MEVKPNDFQDAGGTAANASSGDRILDAHLTSIDAELGGAGLVIAGQAANDAKESAAEEWAYLPKMVKKAFALISPELAAMMTDEGCLEWGNDAAAVAEKYGWTSPKLSPEFALVVSTATLFGVPGYTLYAMHKAAKNAAAAQGATGAAQPRQDSRNLSPGGDARPVDPSRV